MELSSNRIAGIIARLELHVTDRYIGDRRAEQINCTIFALISLKAKHTNQENLSKSLTTVTMLKFF